MSIKIENTQVFGWEAAIRGARNPMNSWEKSDSYVSIEYPMNDLDILTGEKDFCGNYRFDDSPRQVGNPNKRINYATFSKELLEYFKELSNNNSRSICYSGIFLGLADHKLLMNLCKGGTEESKWRRMIHVQMDVTAPLYWWKEFETYKVGTVSNSCSTMHKIHAKEFTLDDFSCEHLLECDFLEAENADEDCWIYPFTNSIDGDGEMEEYPLDILKATIKMLNKARDLFLETKDKKYWWQMIQLLPSSYNQKRTIDLNYEVLASQYRQRKEHKLDEWRAYCEWLKTLPYSEFITMEE